MLIEFRSKKCIKNGLLLLPIIPIFNTPINSTNTIVFRLNFKIYLYTLTSYFIDYSINKTYLLYQIPPVIVLMNAVINCFFQIQYTKYLCLNLS